MRKQSTEGSQSIEETFFVEDPFRELKETKTVLMVSYSYPPVGTFLGSLRVVKFAKYLPEANWRPVVLCAGGGYKEAGGADYDLPHVDLVRAFDFFGVAAKKSGISDESNRERWVTRQKSSEPGRSEETHAKKSPTGFRLLTLGTYLRRKLFNALKQSLIPDYLAPWYPFAVYAGLCTLRKRRVDAIYSTALPMTNHLIAARLAKIAKIPWLADFRDPWTTGPIYSSGRWRQWIDRRIERSVLKRANLVSTVSEEWKEQLSGLVTGVREKTIVIENGFDQDDLAGIGCGGPRDRFVLNYCGEFYGGRRRVDGLLRALAKLKQNGRIHKHNFRFTIVGGIETTVFEQVNRFGIADLVEFANFQPHRKALSIMGQASAGLVITFVDPRSRGEMTTKFYEYVGLRRQVIVLSPVDFEIARTVRRMGLGAAYHPDDEDGIASWIWEQVVKTELGLPEPVIDEDAAIQFSRRHSAMKLGECLDQILERKGTLR